MVALRVSRRITIIKADTSTTVSTVIAGSAIISTARSAIAITRLSSNEVAWVSTSNRLATRPVISWTSPAELC